MLQVPEQPPEHAVQAQNPTRQQQKRGLEENTNWVLHKTSCAIGVTVWTCNFELLSVMNKDDGAKIT